METDCKFNFYYYSLGQEKQFAEFRKAFKNIIIDYVLLFIGKMIEILMVLILSYSEEKTYRKIFGNNFIFIGDSFLY